MPEPQAPPGERVPGGVVYEIDQTEATVTIIAIPLRADVYRPR